MCIYNLKAHAKYLSQRGIKLEHASVSKDFWKFLYQAEQLLVNSESRSVNSDSANAWTIQSMEFSRPEY